MKIHLLSDLHTEFANYTPQITDAEVTILAGDIGIGVKAVEWAIANFPGQVILIAGNHEYYGGHRLHTMQQMKTVALEKASGRVHVLDQEEILLGGVRFLGATAWTDFTCTGNQPLAREEARMRMNDYRKIQYGSGYRKWRPEDALIESLNTRRWVEEKLAQPFSGQTVLVMHHAPSELSLVGRHSSGHLNASYANKWEDLFRPNLTIVHGHTHSAADYELYGTRVISNPRGYPGEKGTGFNPGLLVEL